MADASSKAAHTELEIQVILQRVAGLMQEAFLQFLESTWWLHVQRIKLEETEVVAYGCSVDLVKPFVPFAPGLTSNNSHKAAVLTQGLCDQGFVRMEELFRQLVQGIAMLQTTLSSAVLTYHRHHGRDHVL